jgi:hypothetical protein
VNRSRMVAVAAAPDPRPRFLFSLVATNSGRQIRFRPMIVVVGRRAMTPDRYKELYPEHPRG